MEYILDEINSLNSYPFQMIVEVKIITRLQVSISPPSYSTDLGSSVTFTCSVSDPAAAVTWYVKSVSYRPI